MCPPLVKACFSFSEVFSWEQSGNIAAARIWGVVYVALGTNRCCQIWHLDPNRVCTYINRELLSVFDYLQFVRFRRGLVTTVSPSPLDFLGCGFADDDDESLCGRHVCVCVCGKLCNRFRCHWRQVLPQKEIREKKPKRKENKAMFARHSKLPVFLGKSHLKFRKHFAWWWAAGLSESRRRKMTLTVEKDTEWPFPYQIPGPGDKQIWHITSLTCCPFHIVSF